MHEKIGIVVTSVSPPNKSLRALARGCEERGHQFFVIGDESSPRSFYIDGTKFFNVEQQIDTGFEYARICPKRNYARKNIGYLLASQNRCSIIVETDDDNAPLSGFWEPRDRHKSVPTVESTGWLNIYRYFTDSYVWPRGLPLQYVTSEPSAFDNLSLKRVDCPIQQGLVDNNPDVDAVYRLIFPSPQSFRDDRQIALGPGAWSPFNSQNTTWWLDAYPLLYLPATCSFRMTDIWRSFIAQRIAWTNDWAVLFHEPTVRQERNEHNLMQDFKDEIPGYLFNHDICERLSQLSLRHGKDSVFDNMRICYEELVKMALIDEQELVLLEAWIRDLHMITRSS